MKIEFKVVKGPYKGTILTYEATEPDRIIVGRDGEGCQAHLRLERGKDMYVSRNHFLMEIRPPNCFIMDSTSKNKTYIRRKDSHEFEELKKGQLYPIHDGDLLKLGPYTVIAVKIEYTVIEKPEMQYFCHKCGKPMQYQGITREWLVCKECLAKEEEMKKPHITCFSCGSDVTSKANSDGRAKELLEVCLYLCDKCVNQFKESLPSGVPSTIQHYLLLKELGRGGMGVVFKVWDEKTFRVLALKMILPDYLKNQIAKKFFQREMNITSALVHPNIVRYIGGAFTDKGVYFVMEYVNGISAHDLLKDYSNGLPINLACEIICQALDGLEYAHSHPKRFIHRDLKPSNILLKKKNGKYIAKISDFGLAKSMDEAGDTILAGQPCAGTLLYMSPQQIINYKSPEPHFDTYSMGVSFYELLTGRLPFHLPGPLSILRGFVESAKLPKHPIEIVLYEPPISVLECRPDLPDTLARVVDKSIKKKPHERYPSAKEFKEDILNAYNKIKGGN